MISIHAPREGGDFAKKAMRLRRCVFQSTPPREGGDISISWSLRCASAFQSTPPREGGDKKMDFIKTNKKMISIHAPPARGAT